MKSWLREKLRGWLLDPPSPPSTIEARIDGGIERVAIAGVRGLCLLVYRERGVRLLPASVAVDPREFWRAWKHWQTEDLIWEDGETFEPPE